MFATMNTITAPDSFFGKLKYNLLPPAVKTEVVKVEDGSDFLHLTVPVVRGKIYWNNVRAALGDANRTMLAPAGVPVKESVHLKQFESEKFLSILTLNSFFKLLHLLPRGELLAACAVTDFSGSLASSLLELPRCCRTVTVITAKPEKYEHFCRYALEKYGCAVCVSESISKAFDAPVVLAPKTFRYATAFSRESTVFAASAKNIYTSRLITPEGVSLPEKYLQLLPKGISPTLFAAALYEISGVSSLSRCACPAFRQNNLILSYQDVISMLDY